MLYLLNILMIVIYFINQISNYGDQQIYQLLNNFEKDVEKIQKDTTTHTIPPPIINNNQVQNYYPSNPPLYNGVQNSSTTTNDTYSKYLEMKANNALEESKTKNEIQYNNYMYDAERARSAAALYQKLYERDHNQDDLKKVVQENERYNQAIKNANSYLR